MKYVLGVRIDPDMEPIHPAACSVEPIRLISNIFFHQLSADLEQRLALSGRRSAEELSQMRIGIQRPLRCGDDQEGISTEIGKGNHKGLGIRTVEIRLKRTWVRMVR